MWKRKLTIQFPKSSGVGQTSWERWVGEKTIECKRMAMQRNSIAMRSVVKRGKRIMRGAFQIGRFRRSSKEIHFARKDDLHNVHTYVWSLYSLTNKVEEHCAFPSLLSLICGYLRFSIVDGKTHCALIAAHDDYVKWEKRDKGYIKNYKCNLK